MDDPLEVALRRKKDSSMRVSVQQVKDGAADVAVSAGNTGALMAISRYVLKTVDGIDRPAIATQLPNAKGGATTVLDLGANVDCSEHHLLQFAVMGSALVAAISNVPAPSVGLLNIGEEVIKGSEVIKKAGELLRSASKSGDLNFFGNMLSNITQKSSPTQAIIYIANKFENTKAVGNQKKRIFFAIGEREQRPIINVFMKEFQKLSIIK